MTDGSITRVRAGDLIRAEDFNLILDQLQALDARVSTLEGQGGPGPEALRITSVTPETPRVGDEMKITGSNFGFSTGAHRVFFDSVLVTAYKIGSSDNLLILDVPEIPGLPTTGRATLLRVDNRTQTATRTITVLPRVVAAGGGVDLQHEGASPAAPTAGQPFALGFILNSRTGSAVTMLVTPTSSDSAIQGSMRVLNESGTPISSRQVSVPANGETRFSVDMQVPPGATAGDAFRVTVRAEGQGFRAQAGPISFTVGTAAPTPDPDIQLNLGDAIFPTTRAASTVSVPANQEGEVVVLGEFKQTGTYEISLSTVTGWDVATDLDPSRRLTIESSDPLGPEGFRSGSFSLFLTAPGAGSPPRSLVVTAQREGASQTRELPIELSVQS